MEILSVVLGALLLILAIALVVLVLVQQGGKDKKLSGAIAGGSDTFYGKNKGTDKDKVLSTITAIVAAVFVVIVVAMYLIV